MSLKQTWEEQYQNNVATALKDRNLFEIELNAIIKTCKDLIQPRGTLQPIRVLELGCGTGVLIRALKQALVETRPSLEFFGVDFSSNAISQAMQKRDTQQKFLQADFISFLDSAESESFDIVVTQRSIMALMEVEQQHELLEGINRVLRPGSCGVFSECFTGDFQRFNDLRTSCALPGLQKVWHSRYLDESMIESIFDKVSYVDFCSTYMMITRLIYPLFEEPRHNQLIHDVASRLPNSGSESFLKLAVVRKQS